MATSHRGTTGRTGKAYLDLRQALADVGRPDIMVIVGGVIPPGDFEELSLP